MSLKQPDRGLDIRAVVVDVADDWHLHLPSLSLAPGVGWALMGPTGSGKSTLLSALAGTRPAHSGQAIWEGRSLLDAGLALTPERPDRAYLEQGDTLHPYRTGIDLLRAATRDMAQTKAEERIGLTINSLGLESKLLDRPSHTLSVGQRQRVSMALALVLPGRLLLLDEPFTGQDAQWRQRATAAINQYLSHEGGALLLATHQLEEALYLTLGVTYLEHGRVAWQGTWAEAYQESRELPVGLAAYQEWLERRPSPGRPAPTTPGVEDQVVK